MGKGKVLTPLTLDSWVFPCDLIAFITDFTIISNSFCQVCGMQNRRKTTLLIDLYTDMTIYTV